jgi:PAS domain S-box-containing protein
VLARSAEQKLTLNPLGAVMKNTVKLTYVETRADYEISTAKGIVYSLDLRGNFRFVSEAGRRLCGFSSEELARMNVREMLSPEVAGFIRHELRRAVRQQVGAVYEIEIITKDRRRIRLETSIHLVMRNGRAVEIQGIALPPVGRSAGSRPRCLDADFINGLAPLAGQAG